MKIKKKILAIVYRKEKDETQFLALRNNSTNTVHGGDYYFVVTGGVENGEELQAAVKREIEEETGIKNILNVTDLNKSCEYTCAGEGDFLCREAYFLVEITGEVLHLNEENVEYQWLEKSDFVDLIAWNDKKELQLILNNFF